MSTRSSSATAHHLILYCSSSIFALIFFSIAPTTTTATDHIVGANKGWNPSINYTLWANNQTFYVNDLICNLSLSLSLSLLFALFLLWYLEMGLYAEKF